MLEGRTAELAALHELVDRARAGEGGTAWVVGEPGVGKTALLDALAADLTDEVLVLRAGGREAEVDLAWAAVGALVGALVASGDADDLPEVQRRALRTALALDAPDGPLEPYAAILGAQGTLAAAASRGPVVALVDDAHWLDQSSLAAVSFLASRGPGPGIALIVTSRPTQAVPTPTPNPIQLGPVGPEAADALLATRGVTAVEVRRRVVDELGGTPLLLLSAADALDADQREGRSPLPTVLPVPPSVQDLAAARLTTVPASTRTALLAAAVTGTSEVGTLASALDALGEPVTAIEPAERAGLVVIESGEVRFTHPTIRSASYHLAAAADRRAAHAAVAAATADPGLRAWHLGLATLGVDAEIADELDRSSTRLLERGAPMEAARHLELAARLTPDPATAACRLRRAADAVIEHGHDEAAEGLLDRADRISDDPLEAAHRRRLRLRSALRRGAIDEPVAGLRALAEEVADQHPALSAEILLDVMAPLVRVVRAKELREVADAARERALAAGDERLQRRADVAAGIGRITSGDPAAHELLGRYREVLEVEGAAAAGGFLAEVVAPCLALLQRTPEAEALFATMESELRAQGAFPVLVTVLGAQAIAGHGAGLANAAALGQEAVDLADAIGRPSLGLLAASSLVIATAVIGDRERCTAAAERLLASGEPGMAQAALAGLGALHLGHRELEQSLAIYDRMNDCFGLGAGVLRWEAEWAEALVRTRRVEEARQVIEDASGSDRAALGAGAFSRVRSMLVDDLDEARGHFENAIAYFQLVGNRVGEGRTELAWGERLRRARHRAAGREHLERAALLLREVGATVWAERAEEELTVSGRSGPGTTGIAALTVQELTIARLAVAGASNREIGEQVFLSPRTVETHLSAAFRKLQVRNRRELAGLAAREPALRADAGEVSVPGVSG